MAEFLDSKVRGFGSAFNDITGVSAQNASNAKQAREMMEFSAQEAEHNRSFQTSMSNTAHRREVEDLRAAGLNPLLSGTGGMGANTPSGATGQSAGFPSQNNPNLISTALEARRNHEEVKNLRETNLNIRADTDVKNSARALNSVLYNRTLEETDRTRINRQIEEQDLKGRRVEGEIDETPFGKALRYIDRAGSTFSSALGAARLGQQMRHNRWIRDGN